MSDVSLICLGKGFKNGCIFTPFVRYYVNLPNLIAPKRPLGLNQVGLFVKKFENGHTPKDLLISMNPDAMV